MQIYQIKCKHIKRIMQILRYNFTTSEGDDSHHKFNQLALLSMTKTWLTLSERIIIMVIFIQSYQLIHQQHPVLQNFLIILKLMLQNYYTHKCHEWTIAQSFIHSRFIASIPHS